jgi:hypothetical protein
MLWKSMARRGGIKRAVDLVDELIAKRGVVRACDFERELNSHNWLKVYPFPLKKVAPRIHCSFFSAAPTTAVATARTRGSVIGLESALWVSGLIPAEPLPVQIVVPRGSRRSRFIDPPIEYHWSDTPDPGTFEKTLWDIPVRVHSPTRALVDVIRIRPPERWPRLAPGAFSEPELLELARVLRAVGKVSDWISAQAQQPA